MANPIRFDSRKINSCFLSLLPDGAVLLHRRRPKLFGQKPPHPRCHSDTEHSHMLFRCYLGCITFNCRNRAPRPRTPGRNWRRNFVGFTLILGLTVSGYLVSHAPVTVPLVLTLLLFSLFVMCAINAVRPDNDYGFLDFLLSLTFTENLGLYNKQPVVLFIVCVAILLIYNIQQGVEWRRQMQEEAMRRQNQEEAILEAGPGNLEMGVVPGEPIEEEAGAPTPREENASQSQILEEVSAAENGGGSEGECGGFSMCCVCVSEMWQ